MHIKPTVSDSCALPGTPTQTLSSDRFRRGVRYGVSELKVWRELEVVKCKRRSGTKGKRICGETKGGGGLEEHGRGCVVAARIRETRIDCMRDCWIG